MMENRTLANSYLNIRYVKLHFKLQFIEDTLLPKNKVSALRGGMGEMLLRINCIRNRECETCDFESECMVRRIMYSKMQIQPEFMTSGDSVGYVLECEDYRERFREGDCLEFRLVLFGKTIVYFGQILDAFFRLGVYGLGRKQSRYQIVSVTNTRNCPILHGNDIFMEEYQVECLGDYIDYRKKKTRYHHAVCLHFASPLSVKYQGDFIREFQAEPIIAALRRRLYMLSCFEGIETSQDEIYDGQMPQLNCQESRYISVS